MADIAPGGGGQSWRARIVWQERSATRQHCRRRGEATPNVGLLRFTPSRNRVEILPLSLGAERNALPVDRYLLALLLNMTRGFRDATTHSNTAYTTAKSTQRSLASFEWVLSEEGWGENTPDGQDYGSVRSHGAVGADRPYGTGRFASFHLLVGRSSGVGEAESTTCGHGG